MKIFPAIGEARALAAGYPAVPVYATLPEDTRDPVETFLVLKNLSKQCFILESLENADRRGRYTFLGYDPRAGITCTDGHLTIDAGMRVEVETRDPGAYIQKVVDDYRAPRLPELPPFSGGLVGYFAYDYITYAEPSLDLTAADEEGFRDVDLMLFDKVIAYDHVSNVIFLVVNIRTDALEENYNKAVSEIGYLARLIATGTRAELPPLRLTSPWRELFDEAGYAAMVERAKHHIVEGDIFQAVLSNRLDADAEGSLFETYRRLRVINPSPYMFYFSSDDLEIAGASPETLVTLRDGVATTFPLAGTRPRGATPQEDEALEAELLADPKELAEHRMLVDLGRNDIGKIARIGSVGVDVSMAVLRYSHVMHIGSVVSGRVREGVSATEVIGAVLPAGTLSGAPKIRACQIINELEGVKRGVYGGAIGYLGLTGDLDTCIAIRIAYKKNGKVFVRSGAGIVADSVPAREYAETRAKIGAVVKALEDQQ